jgi:hypothetical protein
VVAPYTDTVVAVVPELIATQFPAPSVAREYRLV